MGRNFQINQQEYLEKKKRLEVEMARYREFEARREIKDKP